MSYLLLYNEMCDDHQIFKGGITLSYLHLDIFDHLHLDPQGLC